MHSRSQGKNVRVSRMSECIRCICIKKRDRILSSIHIYRSRPISLYTSSLKPLNGAIFQSTKWFILHLAAFRIDDCIEPATS